MYIKKYLRIQGFLKNKLLVGFDMFRELNPWKSTLVDKKTTLFDMSKSVVFLVNKCWFSRIKFSWRNEPYWKFVFRKALNAEILFNIQNMCERRIEIVLELFEVKIRFKIV